MIIDNNLKEIMVSFANALYANGAALEENAKTCALGLSHIQELLKNLENREQQAPLNITIKKNSNAGGLGAIGHTHVLQSPLRPFPPESPQLDTFEKFQKEYEQYLKDKNSKAQMEQLNLKLETKQSA